MKKPRHPSRPYPLSDGFIELEAEKMTAGGRCLARSGGKVFFVEGALPGEKVFASVTFENDSYAEATVSSVAGPSPSRITPPCPLHFRPRADSAAGSPTDIFCGGCDWQHIAYPVQLELKKQIVSDALGRVAKIRIAPKDCEIEPSPEPFRYRNKAQVPFAGGDAARREGPMSAGFFARGSHKIVSATDCPLQPRAVFEIVNFVKDEAPRLGIRAYDEDSVSGSLRHLYVRVLAGGDEVMAGFVVNPSGGEASAYKTLAASLTAAFGSVRGVVLNENPSRTSVIFGRRWTTLVGRNHLTETFSDGMRLRLTEGAFFQVNTAVAGSLYRHAAAALSSAPKLLDLYGGAGGFAITSSRLGAAAREIISVEENETAVNDALVNARLNGAENITFYAISAEKFLSRPPRAVRGASVIADPPRAGLSREVFEGIAKLSPPSVLYVSCDPATFARDAGLFCSKGYEMASLRLFDMFPQTHHVEIAALFRLKSRHF